MKVFSLESFLLKLLIFTMIILWSFVPVVGEEAKIAVNQMYNPSHVPLTDNGRKEKETDSTTHPFYEEVAEARTQYAVNMVSPSNSSIRDSRIVNNPIYGADDDDDNEVVVLDGNEGVYTTPVDHHDNQQISNAKPPALIGE